MTTLVRTFKDLGFLRLATVSPEHRVADISFNLERMLESIHTLAKQECRLLVFPELGLTAYTCGDLFFQSLLRAYFNIMLTPLLMIFINRG